MEPTKALSGESTSTLDEGHAQLLNNSPTMEALPIRPSQAKSPVPSTQAFRPLNIQLWDEVKSKSWTARSLKTVSNWKDVPELNNAHIQILVKAKKIACLEISLSDEQKKVLGKMKLKWAEQKRAEFRALESSSTAASQTTTETAPSQLDTEKKTETNQVPGASSSTEDTYVKEHWAPGPFPPYFRNYKTGKASFAFLFTSITRHDAHRIEIGPSAHTKPWRAERGGLELDFASPADADEVFRLLRAVQEELEWSWKMHARAFANVDGCFKTDTPEALLESAVWCESNFAMLLKTWVVAHAPADENA